MQEGRPTGRRRTTGSAVDLANRVAVLRRSKLPVMVQRRWLKSRYRWYVATVFFVFMLLHQGDKLLVGPLTSAIVEDFQINEAQTGAVSSPAIIVSSRLYPVWGYLYDRYARPSTTTLLRTWAGQ